MIPMLLVVKVEAKVEAGRRRPVRLWIPLILVWILLAPLAVLLAPVAILLALVAGLNPFRAMWTIGGVFAALSGVDVEVRAPDANVLVRIQ